MTERFLACDPSTKEDYGCLVEYTRDAAGVITILRVEQLLRASQTVEGFTIDTKAEVVEEPGEKTAEEKKETPEELLRRARKPPTEGPCKRCGLNKPINRLLLCYPCWVKTENEKSGWREGQPHPPTCGCGLDCALESKSAGN